MNTPGLIHSTAGGCPVVPTVLLSCTTELHTACACFLVDTRESLPGLHLQNWRLVLRSLAILGLDDFLIFANWYFLKLFCFIIILTRMNIFHIYKYDTSQIRPLG